MQDTVLFLGGAFSGLRLLRNPIWSKTNGPWAFPLGSEARASITIEQAERYPSIRTERYSYYSTRDFGETTEIMVLTGLDPFLALGQYLRGEFVR